jgi:cytochrome d ubiquinol oxidase subunit II
VLNELPLICILAGLVAYAVLAGADFGAGIWTLLSEPGATRLRAHARHAMGPVWEANHVWLIFVLVVGWTAYPEAIASIASTLTVPLFAAAVGIILRGTAYALRAQSESGAVAAWIERVFGISSILTPFALGAAIGGVASGRVPVGNASGDLLTSWLNPTGVAVGILSVATSVYLASVYLAADANRLREPDLVSSFRTRARITGVVAGALAVAALLTVRSDAKPIWEGLTEGWGLLALGVSGLGGVATLVLVRDRRYEPARVAAALAVAAVVAGWAVAQHPVLLPGLTVDQAAAGHATIVALLVAIAVGAIVLFPALGFLFTLVLRGRFDQGRAVAAPVLWTPRAALGPPLRLVVVGVCFVVGAGLTVLLDSTWGLALGVVLLLAAPTVAFAPLAAAPGTREPSGE